MCNTYYVTYSRFRAQKRDRFPWLTDEEIDEQWKDLPDKFKLPDGVEVAPGRTLFDALDKPKPKASRGDLWRIRPTNLGPIIIAQEGKPALRMARWGFDMSHSVGNDAVNNTRDDTMLAPGSGNKWGKSWRERRCLVPADGFYEFKRVMVEGRKTPKETIPHVITLPNDDIIVIGGIWIEAKNHGLCYSMVTTVPNTAMAAVHDRMPVILHQKDWDEWLHGDEPAHLIEPYTGELVVRRCESPLKKTWRYGPPVHV